MLNRREALQEILERSPEYLERAIIAYVDELITPEQLINRIDNLIDAEQVASCQRSEEGLEDFYGDSGVA